MSINRKRPDFKVRSIVNNPFLRGQVFQIISILLQRQPPQVAS